MKKRILGIASLILLASSGTSYATSKICTNEVITNVSVQGHRDDNHDFEDMLVIEINNYCSTKNQAMVPLASPFAQAALQVAIAAKVNGLRVNLGVNLAEDDDVAHELAYLSLAEE